MVLSTFLPVARGGGPKLRGAEVRGLREEVTVFQLMTLSGIYAKNLDGGL